MPDAPVGRFELIEADTVAKKVRMPTGKMALERENVHGSCRKV